MICALRPTNDHGMVYDTFWFWCPGCALMQSPDGNHGGLHALPVNTAGKAPSWSFDGNLKAPTLEPSILTSTYKVVEDQRVDLRCHSYIRGGMIQFLDDCTHALAGQTVPLPEMPYGPSGA